jgi:SagB-type dehydrogenase family enzyme
VPPPARPRRRRTGASRSTAAAALAPLLALALGTGGISGVARASGDGEVALPEPSLVGEVPVERALALRRSVREFAREPLPLPVVSQLLWAAQGVTHPDGLRTAPSAGALYPLETYLVAGDVPGMRPGLYRYDPARHRLARVSEGDARTRVAAAAHGQAWVAEAPAILVLAAVYERTARKYGERAARYVHMEVGHAAQNVYLEATALGLGTTLVGAFRDEELARALGLPAEAKPLGLLPVGRPR